MTPEYIEQCIVAGEIQEMWNPQNDDLWVQRDGKKWIPRLDQLQQMEKDPTQRLEVDKFIHWSQQMLFTRTAEGSSEEIWLIHVMWVKYGKWWNGVKWHKGPLPYENKLTADKSDLGKTKPHKT